MRLLHVRRLPSLVHQLQKNVDHTLLAASATLPRTWYPIGTRQWDFTMNSATCMSDVAMDEKAIAEIYGKTTAAFCVPLASTLALHPRASKDTWKLLLLWTQSVSPSGYAIMDGELQIIQKVNNDSFDKIAEAMDPETRGIVKEMRSSLTSLATWVKLKYFEHDVDDLGIEITTHLRIH